MACGGDGVRPRCPGGNGLDYGVVLGRTAQLLLQQVVWLLKQIAAWIEDVPTDVVSDADAVVQLPKILRDTVGKSVSNGGVLVAVSWQELADIGVAEWLHFDLSGASAVQGALIPKHLALHERHGRAA